MSHAISMMKYELYILISEMGKSQELGSQNIEKGLITHAQYLIKIITSCKYI